MDTWTREMNISQLAATPPVTPPEEKRLIKVISEGKRAARQLARETLDEAACRELQTKVAEGRAARRTLIEANGRLVISIASKYMYPGMTLAELCQEGVLGLIRAIDKFDESKGVRLSTYATYWIRQSVSRAAAVQGRSIRVPVHRVEENRKLRKATGLLAQKLGRQPSDEELTAETGLSDETIRLLRQNSQCILSLDESDDGGAATLADFLGEEMPLDDGPQAAWTEAEIDKALAMLTARESRILKLRHGLLDGQSRTLEEVATLFGLTRERIRQIEKEALAKLRGSSETVQRLYDCWARS